MKARAAAEEAEELRRKTENTLLSVLEEQELKSTSGVIEDVKYTTSVTSRTTTAFDEAGLKKALGARAYNKLTVAKLDKDKVLSAIDSGDIDAAVVAQHSTVTTGARSIRLTRKVDDGGDDSDEA